MSSQAETSTAPLFKFKTSSGYGGPKIERVQILRETEQSVFLPLRAGRKGERRAAKHSEWEQYHGTWESAHAYLVEKAEEDVADARRTLLCAKGKLGNIKGMKPPKSKRAAQTGGAA